MVFFFGLNFFGPWFESAAAEELLESLYSNVEAFFWFKLFRTLVRVRRGGGAIHVFLVLLKTKRLTTAKTYFKFLFLQKLIFMNAKPFLKWTGGKTQLNSWSFYLKTYFLH
ncbi:hypothetical protein G9Q29_01205 [Flavobacterium sp. F339]|uniref:Uncharacterized protein n=1 Tax=Flavobacterium turcicum TaxID=2764718 RepID=A0ABR7JC32_9FLAO|nr:hypothetical protein [Flavobacterium turcicum]NHL00758.1 hypothetical protein [Flavobacterium turcicum]